MLCDGDEFYLSAFWELSTTRQFGMGVGPIPWNRMVQYAQFHELEEDVARAFVQVMREMDGVYLEWERQEEEHKREERESKAKRGR